MAAKRINLKGDPTKVYDLDDLQSKAEGTNTRQSTGKLIVQIWKWCPDLPSTDPHSKPNPDNLELGQIWLSKRVSKEELESDGESNGD